MIGVMNIVLSYILTNGFTSLSYSNMNLLENKDNGSLDKKKTLKVTPFFYQGTCMIKNKSGENCPMKKTYIIDCIGKCMCEYHLKNKQKLRDIILFYKKMNIYIKTLFQCINDDKLYIETLKDILLLLIKNEKYKNTLYEHFNLTNIYIENFDIKDEEYLALVDYFKSII